MFWQKDKTWKQTLHHRQTNQFKQQIIIILNIQNALTPHYGCAQG